MNKLLFLSTIIILGVYLPMLFSSRFSEGFDNFTEFILAMPGLFPETVDNTRKLSFYPSTGHKGVSNYEAYDMWWRYPIFKVGSYKQMTNNIRYPNNPDNGTCMPADVCFALYDNNQEASNIVEPLPPVPNCPQSGARVGYTRTDVNMNTFVNEDNILY